MNPPMASTITLQQLIDFHSIDRQIYARLVTGLSLDSNRAKKIVAFWYWLERKSYRNFIKMMLSLPHTLLCGFAKEAITCLEYLNSERSLADCVNLDNNTPLMRFLVNQDFSIVQVFADREKAVRVMERFLKDVCERLFNNIVPTSLVANGCYNQNLMANGYPVQFQPVMANGFQGQPMMATVFSVQPGVYSSVQTPSAMAFNGVQVPAAMANGVQVQTPLIDGVQAQPTVICRAQVQPLLANDGAQVPSMPVSPVANGVQVHDNGCNSQMGTGEEDDGGQYSLNVTQNLPSVSNHRTLFITFSKGHSSISKAELRDLITRKFGNCVESIHMRLEPPPLSARVVLKSSSALKTILGENDLVKLCINGKDVWARRFMLKQDEQPPLAASIAGQ